MIEIRNLKPEDAASFKNLRIFCMQESPTRFGSSLQEEQTRTLQSLQNSLADTEGNFFVVGAFSNGNLVATAGFLRDRHEKAKHKGLIWGVYVMPDFRGQKLSYQLMQSLIDQAKAIAGLETLLLTVSASAEEPKRLYQKLGFQKYGHEPDSIRVDGQKFSEDLMRLVLRESVGMPFSEQ